MPFHTVSYTSGQVCWLVANTAKAPMMRSQHLLPKKSFQSLPFSSFNPWVARLGSLNNSCVVYTSIANLAKAFPLKYMLSRLVWEL